ncbi:hypothetical protein [Paucibacter sp. Y2R2-4]|uniref:hypothetical protein n=1 Tax=Paucibacter sp. Y2R2-4 TaxID=2893553 RepID=UPI0021E3EF0C|nr:hypothetical protein [Paucibacter sp. Y2R2-4]MCV2349731.1 hypothetical protein [Paucibacter sp. Y2R2-4]
MIKALILATLYIVAVHYAYVSYINPTFEYAHYTYLAPTPLSLASTYLLSLLVVFAYSDTAHPAQAAAGLIYTLCYVPIQLSLLFSVDQPYRTIFEAQVAIALSMSFIFVAARMGALPTPANSFSFKNLDRFLGLLTIGTIITIITVNRHHMRLVSFEDVYDLREEATSGASSPLFNYLTSLVSYCFLSYFFARGIAHKKWRHLILGILGSIVLYTTTGAKSSLLLLPMTLGVVFLWRSGSGFLARTLFTVIVLIFTLIAALPDEGASLWAKAIILVRVIGTSGWTASKYFEYFGSHKYTYYTHIGPIKSLTGNYPYGENSLGQLIGIEYSGSAEANFNASFWASDGFAACGVAGILIVTIPVIAILFAINRLTRVFESRFTVAWITGFIIAMLNVPLSTALLSGGGGVIFLLAWRATKD